MIIDQQGATVVEAVLGVAGKMHLTYAVQWQCAQILICRPAVVVAVDQQVVKVQQQPAAAAS